MEAWPPATGFAPSDRPIVSSGLLRLLGRLLATIGGMAFGAFLGAGFTLLSLVAIGPAAAAWWGAILWAALCAGLAGGAVVWLNTGRG